MVFSVYPTPQTPTQAKRPRDKRAERLGQPLVRLSQNASPYEIKASAEGAVGLQITPIYRVNNRQQDRLPGLSFSAQLLELGLKHNVEGLIQKAHEQLSYQGAEPHSLQKNAARHYERAQDNFARDTLHMVERQY